MSQNSQILNHLKEYGSITPLDALRHYGCFRLAARISDLKDKGHTIDKVMVEVNKDTKVARYSLRRAKTTKTTKAGERATSQEKPKLQKRANQAEKPTNLKRAISD